MNNSAANYAIGGVLILVAVFSFVFLHGPTSVFIGIGAAIAGVVFLLIGGQAPKPEPELGLPAFDGTPTDSDPWAQFDREHGLGETGYVDPDEPRRNT